MLCTIITCVLGSVAQPGCRGLICSTCDECSLSITQRGEWEGDACHSTGVSPHSVSHWRPLKEPVPPFLGKPTRWPQWCQVAPGDHGDSLPLRSGDPGAHWVQLAPPATWPNQTAQILSHPEPHFKNGLVLGKGEIIWNHFHFVPIWSSEKRNQSRCFTVFRKVESIYRLNKRVHFLIGSCSLCCSLE